MPTALLNDPHKLPGGVLVFEDGGAIVDANATLARMLGREPGTLAGLPIGAVLAPSARVLFHTSIYPVLRLRGFRDECYLSLRRADGSDLPALCNFSLESDAGREFVVCLLMRMSERKRFEDELLRSRRIAEHVPGVVLQFMQQADGSASIPYASEALRELFGLAPMAVRESAEPFFQALHPEDAGAVRAGLRESAARLATWTQRFRVAPAGAAVRWLEGHATPVRLADGALVWHGFIQDISERLAVEQALREKDAANRANRAKSEFLARISHELRTPLNGILGFAQLLCLDAGRPLEGEQRARVGHIEASGRHLLALIDEVLDVTRIDSGAIELHAEWLDVPALLQGLLHVVEPLAAEHGVALHSAAPPGTRLHADRARLSQVLLNLLSNAIKYNHAGGSVRLGYALRDGLPALVVADSGVGLSSEQVAHLFEPFNRLGAEHTPTQGTGLGLVICRRLVELMQGTLAVTSRPGTGSEFAVVLPLAGLQGDALAAPAAPPPAATDLSAPPAPAKRSVLYVEDNPVNVLLMQAIFESRPAVTLEVAGNGREALACALRCPPDLLLLDMHLPDGNGLQLLERLRAEPRLAQVPAVAVSADAMADSIVRSREGGFAGYWTKPLDVLQTLARLDALLLAA